MVEGKEVQQELGCWPAGTPQSCVTNHQADESRAGAQQESKGSMARKAFVQKQGQSLMFTDPGFPDIQFT